METDKCTRLLTHQSIGGISQFVTRNRHSLAALSRQTTCPSGQPTASDTRPETPVCSDLPSYVFVQETQDHPKPRQLSSESSPTKRLRDRSKSSIKAGYGICRVKSMQHLMGRRAKAQGAPVHCCIDLTRYEYRYNRGAAGKEACFPGLPSGER